MSTPSAEELSKYLDGYKLQRVWNKIGSISSLSELTGNTLTEKISSLNSKKQDEHIERVITLSVAGWNNKTQTVSVSGVTADNLVIVGAAPSSAEAYGEATVRCTAQAVDSLTFVCEEVPETALSVNIAIFN